jgi:hypothetical protein
LLNSVLTERGGWRWLYCVMLHLNSYCLHHRPDERNSNHLWNVGQYLPDYTVKDSRRQQSACLSPWEPEISPRGKSVLCMGDAVTLSILPVDLRPLSHGRNWTQRSDSSSPRLDRVFGPAGCWGDANRKLGQLLKLLLLLLLLRQILLLTSSYFLQHCHFSALYLSVNAKIKTFRELVLLPSPGKNNLLCWVRWKGLIPRSRDWD